MARLFFACWPAEDAARALARLGGELATRLDGRAVPAEKIHLTLAFLGELAPERVAAAIGVASALRGDPFTLVLDRLGAFRNARVAWAGASAVDPGLVALQVLLEERLRAAGFAFEARPFKAHLTLARKVGRALREEAMPPVAWRVTDFALVRSESGTGRYTTMERWALG
jgi:2'-5' RNA ligase